MIVGTEQFFVTREYREAFEAHCQRLSGLIVLCHGCYHVLLARPRRGSPFHLLHSVWESLQRFKEWTRSDGFIIAANGATRDFPDLAVLVPKRTAIEVIDETPTTRRTPRTDFERALSSTRLQRLADQPWGDLHTALPFGVGGQK
ncbi:MAG: antibiotic biosynthesis monooxygenase family protein [Pseudomonadota bacterium]